MSPDIPDRFEREYGCTETEWRRWLPAATGAGTVVPAVPSALVVPIGEGSLTLAWTVLEPRAIALVRLPRMQVHFAFDGVDRDQRAAFMRRFDLHLQRGGG